MNCDKFKLHNVDISERIINGDNLALQRERIADGDKMRFFVPVSR